MVDMTLGCWDHVPAMMTYNLVLSLNPCRLTSLCNVCEFGSCALGSQASAVTHRS